VAYFGSVEVYRYVLVSQVETDGFHSEKAGKRAGQYVLPAMLLGVVEPALDVDPALCRAQRNSCGSDVDDVIVPFNHIDHVRAGQSAAIGRLAPGVGVERGYVGDNLV